MGVRRLFSRGGQKFSRGKGPTFRINNNKKRCYFSQNSLKTYYFWPAKAGQGGGAWGPCNPPPDAHGSNEFEIDSQTTYSNQVLTTTRLMKCRIEWIGWPIDEYHSTSDLPTDHEYTQASYTSKKFKSFSEQATKRAALCNHIWTMYFRS
jgi:hypothetical protein